MMDFSGPETAVLNRIQKDFPLTADPYAVIADGLSMDEVDFLKIAQGLKERGVIRNISGIFNAEALGYVSTLVAFSVGDRDIERAASEINAHPGVSHNYLRNHDYNIWFTLACESDEKLDKTIRLLADRSGAKDFIILKNEKLFKIGLMLDVGDGDETGDAMSDAGIAVRPLVRRELSAGEKESVRLLQQDLPIQKDPFRMLVSGSGIAENVDALLANAKRFREDGIMRRYSAVLRHREAGFRSNAMTVWKPAVDADMDSIARLFRAEPGISHLYRRTVIPGKWEYPLFAMVHAKSDVELAGIVADLAGRSGVGDYLELRSIREFKKERVSYFSEKFEEWERRAGI